jgi:hypothetical protein
MSSYDFDEWRSPNRILEVTIHRVFYPIAESVLHQVFGSFGLVEPVLVIEGTNVVLACVVFDSVESAADAYGELHGRNINDDCCQMHIKWGLPTLAGRDADEGDSTLVLMVATSSAASSVVTTPAPELPVGITSSTTFTTTPPIVADNWGRLFDQPAHIQAECDLESAVQSAAAWATASLVNTVRKAGVPVPIQSAIFGAGVFANNWGGLFDGGDDFNTTVSNTASTESVDLHDVPRCDPTSDIDATVSSPANGTSIPSPFSSVEFVAAFISAESEAPPCGNDQAPTHWVNLDAPPFVLALDVAVVAAKVFPSADSKRANKFIEGELTASRPLRALLTVYFGTPSMFITLWFGFDYGTNQPLGTLII